MGIHEVILWFGPAFAWVTLWTQFATLRFFDKSESLFKDLVGSGAIDLAVSNIEASKLIPALAELCDAVATERQTKQRVDPGVINTEDILAEVDFLQYLGKAESALKEKEGIEEGLRSLQKISSGLWKVALLHSFAVILLPTSFFITIGLVKVILASIFGVLAFSSFCWLIYGTTRYQKTRDALLATLSANRSAS